MNIYFQTLYSNSAHYIQNKMLSLTPLQKKVAIFVAAYFSCATLGYTLYHCYSFSARPEKVKNNLRKEDSINKDFHPNPKPSKNTLKPKIIIKSSKSKDFLSSERQQPQHSQLLIEDRPPNPLPTLASKIDATVLGIHSEASEEEWNLDEFFGSSALDEKIEDADFHQRNIENVEIKEDINFFIEQAQSNEDFLSLLRCMADHPEWVCANKEQAIDILQFFGSKAYCLQPIKVIADLYEKLLNNHPELAFTDSLKNTEVIFENKETYRTHLIFALKNLHVIRDQLEEEICDFSEIEEGLEIQLPGHSKTLKAIFQYLDNSDPSEIDKVHFFQLIQMAHQYQIPSIWRYCETQLTQKIPQFLHNSEGDKEWVETLQLYASLDTHNVNFIIDYLLKQRVNSHSNKKNFENLFDSLTDFPSEKAKNEVKERLFKRFDIISDNIEVIREEHEDRIEDALFILEGIAERLSSGASFDQYMSCASINIALKTLFRAAIAKQFAQDNRNKHLLIQVLTHIQSKQQDLILENTWHSFEWDEAEAMGIHSLAVCLLNYLTQEIPDEIKTLSCWHGDSLVLAFNDNSNKKIPLSKTVTSYAAHAVSQQIVPGFYYLFRPSSTVASSNDTMIFTMTCNNVGLLGQSQAYHCRIEAFKDPITQDWLFRTLNSKNAGVPLDDLLATFAKGLDPRPIPAPKTGKNRINTYILG